MRTQLCCWRSNNNLRALVCEVNTGLISDSSKSLSTISHILGGVSKSVKPLINTELCQFKDFVCFHRNGFVYVFMTV